jgi:hypothetical protein
MFGNTCTFMATALAILAFALTPSTAKAQSFTGNFPVAETEVLGGVGGTIKGSNQDFCLMLTDNGSEGRAHSGPATLAGFDNGSLTGTFQVIGNTILVNFGVGSDTGEDEGLVLVAPASNGKIGTGVMGLTGGVPSSGLATFGVKNGC